MNKKSIMKNYIYNTVYQLLTLILPLVTTPYVSRVLGAENIGIYSYTISISTYFILFGSLGIALYGQRQIAYEQGKKKKLSRTFWEIVLLRFVTMIISITIFYFLFVNGNQYQIYYKILLLELLANCFDISWFFQGMEDFKRTVTRNTIIKIISVISILVFVKKEEDLPVYFLIYSLSTLIGNMSLWLYLPQYLKKVKIKQLNPFIHLKSTILLFIPQIAIQVYTVLDKTMIGVIIPDKTEVGYYEQSQKIIKMLLTVITSLGTVMLPRIANSFANGEKNKIKEYITKSFNMVFFLSFPMILGIISISDIFVPIFFGQGYEKVALLMKIISPILLFIGLSNVTGTQYLLSMKRQKEFTISVIAGAVTNFIMNMLLIQKLGAIGASIGTVIAELTVTSIQIYFLRKEINFKSIFINSINYFIASVIMFIICLILSKLVDSETILLILKIGIGAFSYVIMLIILKDRMVFDLINKFINRLKGKKYYEI